MFNAPQGGWGTESGQNVMVFWIEGDTTSAAQALGNNYAYEIIWNWEIIPTNPQSVAYSLTPSTCNLPALQTALNLARRVGLGHFARSADILPETGGNAVQRPRARAKQKKPMSNPEIERLLRDTARRGTPPRKSIATQVVDTLEPYVVPAIMQLGREAVQAVSRKTKAIKF